MSLRQIVLDTETTGLDFKTGHRIIEIGAVELIDRTITENSFHVFINPEREVDAESFAVHHISTEFLRDKPTFAQILPDFLAYIGDSELIAHNATFDIGFLDFEINLADPKLSRLEQNATITDTLAIARHKFPGQHNTLDALCKRYQISLDERMSKGHGALLDAILLAKVYLLMTGGQSELLGDEDEISFSFGHAGSLQKSERHLIDFPPTMVIKPNEAELLAHQQFLKKLDPARLILWEENNE